MTPDTNDIEQYRPGFEAWARDKWFAAGDFTYHIEGQEYAGRDTQVAWESWVAAKREASAEPSGEVDERYEFERVMSQRGEAANYIGDGMYSTAAIQDQWEIWLERAQLPVVGAAQKDDAKDAARYRLLRNTDWFSKGFVKAAPKAGTFQYMGKLLDREVDAAIEAHAKAQEKGE